MRKLLSLRTKITAICGDPMNDVSVSQLWNAKYIYESTYDTYSDDKAILLGRPAAFVPMTAIIGGAMLTYHQRILPIILCQWAYQTFQLAIRYAERPHSSVVTDSDLLTGYAAGTVGAISTALLYHKIFKCSAPIIARMGPLAAVIVGTCISIPVTRYRELDEGIPIYDEKERKLGYSTKAAQHSVLMDVSRQLLVQIPPLLLAPFYMEYLDERGTLCRYPYMNLPNQMLFVGLFTALFTPFLRALIPEKGSMSFTSLQEDLQDCIVRRTGVCPLKVFYRLSMSPT
ncbi:hypothetical protein L9F63_008824 [Diploptera punctata]|uniref:Uncharacterized protein n=1 Tax=Diploptera punctata TaxID=6984 RepID=A0AAD7Z4T0_DIPPU|nr:hypothetical protein L9F63_008824 [Diploptera punctata]